MKARVNWVENVLFVAESDSGHAIVLDGAAEGGGRNIILLVVYKQYFIGI